MANVQELASSRSHSLSLFLSIYLSLSLYDRQIEMPAVSSLGIQVRVRNLWWGLVLQPRLLHRHRHRHRGLLMCWCCVVVAILRPATTLDPRLACLAVKYEVGYCAARAASAAARATATYTTYACTQRMSWEPVKCASVPNRRTVCTVRLELSSISQRRR